MPIVLFFIFVAVVSICTLALGYVLAPLDEQTESRRCQMPHEMYRRGSPEGRECGAGSKARSSSPCLRSMGCQ